MVGEVPPDIEGIINDPKKANSIFAPVHLRQRRWDKKRKYEENTLVVDLRSLDGDGSLDATTKLDKDTNKLIPYVEVISGCLIVKVRREL